MGRLLEGTETLAQRLASLRQKTFDPSTRKPRYLTVQELHQRYQFLLIEIKVDTPPADILQLDQLFLQAVSKDLRKKLLTHFHPLPATTNNENVQRFSDLLVQHANEAENELTTMTNIASRAAQHRQAKPCTMVASQLNRVVVPEPSSTASNKSPTMGTQKTLACMLHLV